MRACLGRRQAGHPAVAAIADSLTLSRSTLIEIGVADRVIKTRADQAADIFVARDAAARIGIADRAPVVPDQPADIVVARHAAGGISIADHATIEPNQTADIAVARNAAGHIGIADRATIEPNQTANPADPAGIDDVARNAAGRIGIADRATIIVPEQPADIAAARNAAGRIGIADRATIIVPEQPADIVPARNAATLKADIAQDRPGTCNREKADKTRPGTIDRQPGDHMSVAIKRPVERGHIVPDRLETRAVTPAGGRAGVDILSERIDAGETAGGGVDRLKIVERVDQHVSRQRRAAARIGRIIDRCAVRRRIVVEGNAAVGGCLDAGAETDRTAAGGAAIGAQHDPGPRVACKIGVDGDVAIGRQRQRGAARPCDGIGNGDIAVLAAAGAGRDRDIGAGKRRLQRVHIDHTVITARGEPARVSAVRNRDIVRIEQQRAEALRARQIGKAGIGKHRLAGNLGIAAGSGRTLGADPAGEIGAVIRPQHNRAAIALGDCIGADHRARAHRQDIGMRDIARALPVAADAHLAARAIAGGIDHGVIEIDLKPGDFDRAALGGLRLCLLGAGRDLARDRHLAAIAAAKRDLAIAARNRARLGNAGKIDGVARCGPRRCRLHHDHAAFGRHRTGIFNQRLTVINQRRGHRHLHEAVTGQIKRDLLAGAKPGLAIGNRDQPAVLHLAAHQRDIAAAPDRHHALVGNSARSAIAAEHHIAGHEVVIGDIER